MKAIMLSSAIVAVALLGPCAVLAEAEVEPESEDGVLRLAPSAFSILPPAIVVDLRFRGCYIPQTYGPADPHNVIRGEFRNPGQQDWAVLWLEE